MNAPPASIESASVRQIFALVAAVILTQPLVTAGETGTGAAPPTVSWREDLGTAQAEAKERDLPLWIQFTGPWCINCRRMDRDTFHHSKILEQSRDNFVPIKLRSDVHEQLALNLGLSALPATVIVRPSGEVILSMEGYANPDELDGFLMQSLARDNRLTKAEKIARAKLKNEQPQLALAGFCPVTLVSDKKLEAGKEPVNLVHEGRIYRFADEAKRDEFLKAPELFVPRHEGFDAVTQVDYAELKPGDPRYGMLYKGQLFLFSDESSRKAFMQNPQRYVRMQLRHNQNGSEKPPQSLSEQFTLTALRKTSRELLNPTSVARSLGLIGDIRVR